MDISEDFFSVGKRNCYPVARKSFSNSEFYFAAYLWQIGKLIVEDEQKGKERAEYGKYTLKNLSKKLTLEFGKVLMKAI